MSSQFGLSSFLGATQRDNLPELLNLVGISVVRDLKTGGNHFDRLLQLVYSNGPAARGE